MNEQERMCPNPILPPPSNHCGKVSAPTWLHDWRKMPESTWTKNIERNYTPVSVIPRTWHRMFNQISSTSTKFSPDRHFFIERSIWKPCWIWFIWKQIHWIEKKKSDWIPQDTIFVTDIFPPILQRSLNRMENTTTFPSIISYSFHPAWRYLNFAYSFLPA